MPRRQAKVRSSRFRTAQPAHAPLIPKHHCASPLQQHSVGEVPADSASERLPFAIAPETQQIVGVVKMIHTDDVLLNNRALVEVGGDVVASRADEFHAALPRALVRICPDK